MATKKTTQKETKVQNIVFVNHKLSMERGWNTAEYAYSNPLKLSLKDGDFVIVSNRYGPALAKVITVSEERATRVTEATCSIIAKVDMSKFEAFEAKQKRKAELREILDEKIEELSQKKMYESLKTLYPELSGIIDELETLDK